MGSSGKTKQYVWLNVPPWWRRLAVTNFAACGSNSTWPVRSGFHLSITAKSFTGANWTARLRDKSWAFNGQRPRPAMIRLSLCRCQQLDALTKNAYPFSSTSASRPGFNACTFTGADAPSVVGRPYASRVSYTNTVNERSRTGLPTGAMVSHRSAPPGVPPESAQVPLRPDGDRRSGHLFDLVRDLIMAAWRWVDDDPTVTHEQTDRRSAVVYRRLVLWLAGIQRRAVEPSCATSSTWSAH